MYNYFEVESPGKIKYLEHIAGTPKDGEILVKRVGCGICRSDVGVFDGKESIPHGMFGHESYGIAMGDYGHIKKGDYVASFWHPGYASEFVAPGYTCVKIKELDPRYAITQPFATVLLAMSRCKDTDVLVIGKSGFTMRLAMAASYFNVFPGKRFHFETDEDLDKDRTWDCVLEMSGNRGLFSPDLINDEATIVWFSTLQKPVTTNLFEWSWKAATVIFPSPRMEDMQFWMGQSSRLLDNFIVPITHIFNFDQAQLAFETASKRSGGYVRGVFVEKGNII